MFSQRPSSLCWVFPTSPDNAPWCDLCSAEPDTAVATLRTHRTEVDPFRCSPPPLHLLIASFPAWLCPSLRSFFFVTVILVSMWTAGMLTVFEMWCWAATACGLDKMDRGRRRVVGYVRKLSECAPYISFSHFLCPVLCFSQQISKPLPCLSLLLLNQRVSLSQKRTSVSFCSSHLSFSFWSFFPLVSFERHLDQNCLGSSCPSLYIGESKSIVGPTAWSSNCYTLNLCQTNPIVRPWSHLNKSWSEGLITFHFYRIKGFCGFCVKRQMWALLDTIALPTIYYCY